MDTPIFQKELQGVRNELRLISVAVDELRLELQKARLTERARRVQADLGFRGDLGWQCLRCGEDFRTLRDAENHLFLISHCRKCGRALPGTAGTAVSSSTPTWRLGSSSALCEFCSAAFMQARLKKRLAKKKLVKNGAPLTGLFRAFVSAWPDETSAFTQDSLQFRECHECSKKPGAPELCAPCFHNRRAIERLMTHIESLTNDTKAVGS